MRPILFPLPFKTNNGHLIARSICGPAQAKAHMMALVDRRRQLDGRVGDVAQERLHARAHTHTCTTAAAHLGGQTATRVLFCHPDPTSGFCKSGLSASEDSDHIRPTRRMGGLSTQQGVTDRRGGRRASRAGVEPTRAAGDLISRHYNDGQTIIISYYLRTAVDG